MKAAESKIVSYCDFCGDKKKQSKSSCIVCGADCCGDHRYLVAKRKKVVDPYSLKEEEHENFLKSVRYAFAYDLVTVCPECGNQPLSKISLILATHP